MGFDQNLCTGTIKELRETPGKKNQRFVEFYDVRDAAKALKELNGKEINGRQIVIEFSRPGGHTGKLINKAAVTGSATIPTKNIVTSSPRPRQPRYLPPPPPLPGKISGHLPSNVSPRSFLSQKRPFTIKSPNPSTSNGSSSRCISVEASMGKLSLSGGSGNGIEKKAGNGIPRKSAKKSHNSPSIASSSKQQYSRNRPWKSKQVKRFDPRFLISQDAMIEADCRDSRTTVMIKNIPNKYRSINHLSQIFIFFLLYVYNNLAIDFVFVLHDAVKNCS